MVDSKTHPLVSIIIPFFNREKYIVRCVNSVLNQTYQNIEIILVDDGSTDNTFQICTELQKKDNRIKLIKQKKSGIGDARNGGLIAARGEYISFVDSDDWVSKEMIEILVNFSISKKLSVVECDMIKSDAINDFDVNYEENFIIESKKDAVERIIKHKKFAVWRRLYKKSILENLRFVPNKIYEDIPFTMEVMKQVDSIGYLNKKLYTYFVEDSSAIRSKLSKNRLDSIECVLSLNKYSDLFTIKAKEEAEKLQIIFLANTYDEIFKNKFLDKDLSYRKQIKKIISNYKLPLKTKTKVKLIKLLPIKLYGMILNIKSVF